MIHETQFFVIPSVLVPELFKAFKRVEKSKKFKVEMNVNIWDTKGHLFEFDVRFREFTEATLDAGVIKEFKTWLEQNAIGRDDDIDTVPFTISPVQHPDDADDDSV